MKNYIIGGGISGLIASMYNKDFRIISRDIGGQFSEKFLGPRILEVNQDSLYFLNPYSSKILPNKIPPDPVTKSVKQNTFPKFSGFNSFSTTNEYFADNSFSSSKFLIFF